MKTRLTIATFWMLLILLASYGAGISFAEEPAQPPNHVISFTGRVEDMNSVDETMYVTIQMTNNPYIYMRGDTVWVYTTGDTIYYTWVWDDEDWIRVEASFAVLKAMFDGLLEGEELRVSINADVIDTLLTANRVEVEKPRY